MLAVLSPHIGERYPRNSSCIILYGWIRLGSGRDAPQDKGWKALFDSAEPDEKEDVQKLPAVRQGESVQAIITEHGGMTKPPKAYSEGQLIQLMKTAGKAIEDEEAAAILKEVEGIGTEATRASIIETVKNKGYIEVNKNIVSVTAKGEVLCQALANSIVSSPALTAKWESKLRLISEGELALEQFVDEIKGFIR